MSKLDKAKESLIGKIDGLFGFNLSNRQDGISYDFGQYRLNKLYKPLVKYFIDQYMSHLEQYSQQEAEKILWLFSDFFSLYYNNGDFWYFKNKFSTYQYRIPYSGKDTEFWRATKDCYYVKTSDVVNDMAVNIWWLFGGTNKELSLKLFKKTHAEINESWEEKFVFDLQVEEINDEESEELIWYKIVFVNWDESKEKTKMTTIKDLLAKYGIEYDKYPWVRKSIDEFLKKRGRDYFIHKRLKAFLTEELERYFFQMLKTDIQAKADILSIQKKIEEIKAKYSDDQAVIDFKIGQLMKESQSDVKLSLYETSYLWILNFVNILADLEEFKAKLWNKKRKIVNQEYCISIWKIKELETLIPRREEILKAIAENKTQIQEWKDLWMKTDSNYLENDFLVVDTKNFSGEIKEHLLELARSNEIIWKLFQSDNYQALKFLEEEYAEKIKCIYIDPPYNTGNDWFIYKDSYQSASWLSMMQDRINIVKNIISEDGVIFTSIDDNEINNLMTLQHLNFNESWNLIRKKTSNPNSTWNNVWKSHEYITFAWKNPIFENLHLSEDEISEYTKKDEFYNIKWPYKLVWLNKTGTVSDRRPNLEYKIEAPDKSYIDPKPRRRRSQEKFLNWIKENRIFFSQTNNWRSVYYKQYLNEDNNWNIIERWKQIDSILLDYWTTTKWSTTLKEIFWNNTVFDFPKPIELVRILSSIISSDIYLDFFAWSWTTWHSVLKLNKEDWSHRKFILVELGRYFDAVTLKRIKKVMYSQNRKDGEAKDNDWSQSIIEYTKLNQYEDRFNAWWYLDNLEWDINHLSNTDVAKIWDIKQVLFPLSQLKDRIYGLDDEIIW